MRRIAAKRDRAGTAPAPTLLATILAVATGMEEHADYARAFIDAASELKQRCPGVHVSGGVSNPSFSFRGNNRVRAASHSAFLYHAIRDGMDMGIANAVHP